MAVALVLSGAAIPGANRIGVAWAAGAAKTVELSGDSVEYDVQAKLSHVLGKPGAPAVLRSEEMVLTGDRIEYNEAASTAKVEGNVRLERLSPDRVVLTAEEIFVDVAKETAVAKRKVKLVRDKTEASAAQAVFSNKERQVVLTGEPVVRSGGNTITGSEILYSLANDKVAVRGGSKVVVVREDASK
jgi:lipopolysaccharide transport protein LptA